MDRPESVLILCGGKGTRMASATSGVPKTLTRVADRPMLDHILALLGSQGFRRFVLATGFLSTRIEEHVAGLSGLGLDIQISNAGEDAGMLRRIAEARPKLAGETIVLYGDTFIDLKFPDVVASHRKAGAPITILTGTIQNPFGIVSTEEKGGLVRSFQEKPVLQYYIGGMVWSPSAFDLVTPDLISIPDGGGLVRLFERLIARGELRAYRHLGLQVTFNTEGERAGADQLLSSYFTLRER